MANIYQSVQSNADRYIAFCEARSAVDPKDPLKKRLKAAMQATRDHWMCIDDYGRFVAACCAAAVTGPEEEKNQILEGLKAVDRSFHVIGALAAGVPLKAEAFELLDPKESIGLLKLWENVKATP